MKMSLSISLLQDPFCRAALNEASAHQLREICLRFTPMVPGRSLARGLGMEHELTRLRQIRRRVLRMLCAIKLGTQHADLSWARHVPNSRNS